MVGHGRRTLVVLGPVELAAAPEMVEVTGRRYLCLPCGAVCLVMPSGVVAGRRYFMPAVGLALALWALGPAAARSVRKLISPFTIIGDSVVGWASLRRWARTYGVGDGTLRTRAARFAQALLATSPLSAQTHAIEARIFAASLSHRDVHQPDPKRETEPTR